MKLKGVNSFTVAESEGKKSLVLKQGFMAYADEVIKEQVVNILAVLTDDFSEAHLFENVLISGESTDTIIEIPKQHRGRI